MSKTFKLAAFVALVSVGAAFAQSASDQVVAGLQAQGFTRVEVKNSATQMKVEAIRGDQKIELVYDTATGQLLKHETGRVGADDDTTPGVEVRNDDGSREHGAGHRSGRDDDEDDDHHSSDDDGSDDDSSDDDSSDHGGSHGSDYDSDSDSDSDGDSDSDD